jgi:hypothetical protein
MGRPRFRRLEDVEKDLTEMKFNRWRQKAVDSEELAPSLKANSHMPYSVHAVPR